MVGSSERGNGASPAAGAVQTATSELSVTSGTPDLRYRISEMPFGN